MKTFLKSALLGAALLLPMTAAQAADTYTLDPMHTSVIWVINHFGFSNPSGKFAQVQGTLILDEKNPENSKVTATIPIANLVTGIDKLDEHVKSKDFLDAAQFPTATFVSDKVTLTTKASAKVSGTLTLHGVSKPVVLNVTLNKIGDNFMKKHTAGFSMTTSIKRSDFGINAYLPGLSDEVAIEIESEANLPGAAAPASPAPAAKP